MESIIDEVKEAITMMEERIEDTLERVMQPLYDELNELNDIARDLEKKEREESYERLKEALKDSELIHDLKRYMK